MDSPVFYQIVFKEAFLKMLLAIYWKICREMAEQPEVPWMPPYHLEGSNASKADECISLWLK